MAHPNSKGRKKPKRSGGISQEHGKWTCYVGRHPVTQQKIRLYGYATAEEARHAQAVARAAQSQIQSAGEALSGPEQADAAQALAKLMDAKLASPGILAKAATEYLARHPQANPTTAAQFHETWLAEKIENGRRKKTIRSARSCIKPFLDRFGALDLTAVTLHHIRVAVQSQKTDRDGNPMFDHDGKPVPVDARTKINRLVVLKNFFSSAQRHRLIGRGDENNPAADHVKPKATNPAPTPFSLFDAQRLLDWAWETEAIYGCATFIAVALFCGVRTGELFRLHWGAAVIDPATRRVVTGGVDLQAGTVTIAADASKIGAQRVIPMPPNLRMILAAIAAHPRPRKKHARKNLLIAPATGAALVKADELEEFKRFIKSRGFHWLDNGTRDSFAAYEYAASGLHATIAKLGHHGSTRTFLIHYASLATPEEATAYFNLLPHGMPTASGSSAASHCATNKPSALGHQSPQ